VIYICGNKINFYNLKQNIRLNYDEKTLGDLCQMVANSALQVTPIICVPNPPSANPVGCGIFLRINNDRYLLTAGHLLNLKDWKKLLVPGAENKMIWLKGKVYTTYEELKTINNPIDYAVLKFSETQNKHFGGEFTFCNPENIIVNHKVKENGLYIIAGYPVSGVKKVSGSATFITIPVKFLTHPVKLKKYEKIGINPDHFILVNYQRKIAPFNSRIKNITKDVKGISGSGLWYIPNLNDKKNGIPKHYLVGIMTENYKDYGALAALRIDFITETIKQFEIYSPFEHTTFKFEESIKDLYVSELK
jgi:hypothetical protein